MWSIYFEIPVVSARHCASTIHEGKMTGDNTSTLQILVHKACDLIKDFNMPVNWNNFKEEIEDINILYFNTRRVTKVTDSPVIAPLNWKILH
jgi:hypothetical protein